MLDNLRSFILNTLFKNYSIVKDIDIDKKGYINFKKPLYLSGIVKSSGIHDKVTDKFYPGIIIDTNDGEWSETSNWKGSPLPSNQPSTTSLK